MCTFAGNLFDLSFKVIKTAFLQFIYIKLSLSETRLSVKKVGN